MNGVQGWKVYDILDRSTVKTLKRKGKSANQIAEILGMDRKTVLKILKGPTEPPTQKRNRDSAVDTYADQIKQWIARGTPVKRMLELAREGDPPYVGSRSEFYNQVGKIRAELKAAEQEVFVRFGSLPGEYCQIDWGEIRNFPFTKIPPATRYFFCARLKFSGVTYVSFESDTRLETLIRCMLRAFEHFGGVPWTCVFDNMKTVTVGRDERHRPIWNETFLKFMVELESHPLACWPESPNQKGSVENLVGWVRSNFIPERTFADDQDLQTQLGRWLERVTGEVSGVHGQIPRDVWEQFERPKLIPLATGVSEYGLAFPVKAGSESLVHIDSNRYSVPVGYVKVPLLARIRQDWVEFYNGENRVARHRRAKEKLNKPIRDPEHYGPVFKKKPRAQVMLYRDHLIDLDGSIRGYIESLCYRNRSNYGPAILEMYELWKHNGTDALGAACAVASEHGCYGPDYLKELLKVPKQRDIEPTVLVLSQPGQDDVDRPLTAYQSYVRPSGGV